MTGRSTDHARSGSSRSTISKFFSSSATPSRPREGTIESRDSAPYPYSNLSTTHLPNYPSKGEEESQLSVNTRTERYGFSVPTTSQLQIPDVWESTPSGGQRIRSESFSYSRYPDFISSSLPAPKSSFPEKMSQPMDIHRPSKNEASNPVYSSSTRGPAHLSSSFEGGGRSPRSYPVKPPTAIMVHGFLSNPPIMLLKRAVDRNTEQMHRLDHPATNPPVHIMLIESSLIPWKIRIDAPRNTGFVSVADALNGIYSALQEPVTKSEYGRIDKARAKAVKAAYFKRTDQESARHNEPIRKIDWLEGRYVFEGLAQSNTDHNSWILRVGWPRKR